MSFKRFVPLDSDHQAIISQFRCEDEPAVELFLKNQALFLHEHDSAKTHLYLDEDGQLIGFFTLFNDHVRIPKSKIEQQNWSLPDLNWFPAIKLHYLGVDSRFRNLGYGRHLLMESIELAEKISADSGCNFLILEAFQSTVPFYEKYGFTKYHTTKTYIQGARVPLTEMALNLQSLHAFV